VLQFLERRFGVEVPALSAWRRETTGDLLSTFDFTHADTSVPGLPDTVAHLAKIEENCRTLSLPPLATTQTEPVQED
jgi:phospholipase C